VLPVAGRLLDNQATGGLPGIGSRRKAAARSQASNLTSSNPVKSGEVLPVESAVLVKTDSRLQTRRSLPVLARSFCT
jgi:hypothetical protein